VALPPAAGELTVRGQCDHGINLFERCSACEGFELWLNRSALIEELFKGGSNVGL
jgi:hypothetical protein